MTVLDAPSPAPTAVDPELLFREARQRRRRRWLIAGTFCVVVFAILAISSIVLFGRTAGRGGRPHGSSRPPTPLATVHPYPKQMVIVNATVSQLDVISSTTGKVVRNLTSDAGTFNGTVQPSVTPSGTVYFDHAGRARGEPSEQIWSVPVSGGRSTFVSEGRNPVVSPNGTLLAYLTWTALTNAPDSIVVMNIATGTSTTWSYSTNVPEISDLSWAPDSQSLAFTTSTPGQTTWTNGAWSVPLSNPNRLLDSAQPIRLLPGAFWVGYMNSTQAMEVLVHRSFLDQGDSFQPVVVDVATGQVVKRLPVLSGLTASPPGGNGEWQIDPTGHWVALIKQRNLPNGTGTVADLYRWLIPASTGRHTPHLTIVRRGVWSSAWVPGS